MVVTNTDDADTCTGASTCNAAGACKAKNGEMCTVTGDCATGTCTDNRCCSQPCGVCQACTGAGGTCVVVTSADDADTCTGVSTCDATGACKKKNGQACTIGADCASGTCNSNSVCGALVANRCSGVAPTCGPSGNGDCCASLQVPGNLPTETFYRSYDGVTYTDKSYPATVSDFYLDKYEITVGRFRQFVNAGMGTQDKPPEDGAGAHPLIEGSGWKSAWNTNLPANADALKTAMKCDSTFQTWTDAADGGNESRPQNCINWYEAFSFCAWDGGRLATEAEWNYAAAGGSEQREYPWGSGIDASKASYNDGSGCTGNGNPDCVLTDLIVVGSKPAGNGKWGHSDLAGNVWEWTLDWYATYHTSCNNCADLADASSRVLRGGDFGFYDVAAYLLSSYRGYGGPWFRGNYVGARCARTSL